MAARLPRQREGTANPFSRLTIASFSDLGYRVSHAGADSYALRRAPSLRAADSERSQLGAATARSTPNSPTALRVDPGFTRTLDSFTCS